MVPIHTFHVDKKVLSGEIDLPWTHQIDPNELVSVSFTINQILNIFNQRLMFRIPNKLDIVKVYKYINRYLLSVQSIISSSALKKEHKDYFSSLINFNQCIETMLNKLAKHDPGIAEQIRSAKITTLDTIIDELN